MTRISSASFSALAPALDDPHPLSCAVIGQNKKCVFFLMSVDFSASRSLDVHVWLVVIPATPPLLRADCCSAANDLGNNIMAMPTTQFSVRSNDCMPFKLQS
jgi:hypothetical protein